MPFSGIRAHTSAHTPHRHAYKIQMKESNKKEHAVHSILQNDYILLVCVHCAKLFSHYFKVHSLYEKVYYKPVNVMLHQQTASYILFLHSIDTSRCPLE